MVISIYGGSGSGKTTLATALHEGKDTITLRHLEREDGEILSEETDFSGISVLLLEWTHGGSDDLHGVDLSVFLESSPEETKERRIRRNRVENAASPFICRVVELEQEKLEVQRKNAGFSVIDYDLNEQLADREDLDQLKNMGINLKLDFILNHASAQSPQFRDLVEKGEASAHRDFFIDWNHFWEGHGRQYLGQMDVNIQSPKVWEFYRETLEKIASYGAAIVRLDAFAYAPKTPGKKLSQ